MKKVLLVYNQATPILEQNLKVLEKEKSNGIQFELILESSDGLNKRYDAVFNVHYFTENYRDFLSDESKKFAVYFNEATPTSEDFVYSENSLTSFKEIINSDSKDIYKDIYRDCFSIAATKLSSSQEHSTNIQMLSNTIDLSKKVLGETEKAKALFLDRDGIIIKDTHYPHRPEDLHINQECVKLIQSAQQKDYRIVLLSNQSGVAREKFSYQQMLDFHSLLEGQLNKQFQVKLDAFYYCPYHHVDTSQSEYSKFSHLRKPYPGMLLKACQDLMIDPFSSIMIGDKLSDQFLDINMRFELLQSEYSGGKATIKSLNEVEI